MDSVRSDDPGVLARGSGVFVRRRKASDLETFLHWSETGSWRDWDAPWETTAPNYRVDYPVKFAAALERERTGIPLRALVCMEDGTPIGQLSLYGERQPRMSVMVGIDICLDSAMGKGYGGKALALWIDWLFSELEFHRVGLETWSYNTRMLGLADKLGFRREGCVRQLQLWNGSWHDRHLFGMLREEWSGNLSRDESKP